MRWLIAGAALTAILALSNAANAAVTVTATRDGVTATGTVTVAAPVLTALAIENAPSAALPKGRTWPLTALGTFSDGSSGTVTSGLVWSSTASAVISVTSTASGADLLALSDTGSADLTVSDLSGSVVSAPVTVTAGPAVVDTVAVIAATIPRGTTQQLSANVTWSDGTQGVVGAGAAWSSDTPANIAVTGSGTASTPGAVGSSAVVTATFDGVSGTATVTVGAPDLVSLTLSPATVDLAKGLTQALTVTAAYSDGSSTPLPSLTWQSSAPTVVSVTAAGVVKAEVASGSASITASSGAVTSNAVTVTAQPAVIVSLSASAPSQVKQNVVGRATATANYSDGTTADVTSLVTWASAGAASVSNVIGAAGTIIPSAVGTASISATGSGFTADAGQVAVVQVVGTAQDAGAPNRLVISQVYGAGGNASATYQNDFVELHNPTASTVRIGGWSIQYTSATGTSWGSNMVTLPDAGIPAGGYYLVRLASGGSVGAAISNFDVSGTVDALGDGVNEVHVGDAVIALLPMTENGSCAEYVIAPAQSVAPAPRRIPLQDAAAIPCVALTAWQALFDHAGLRAGQRVLINGAGGAVGERGSIPWLSTPSATARIDRRRSIAVFWIQRKASGSDSPSCCWSSPLARSTALRVASRSERSSTWSSSSWISANRLTAISIAGTRSAWVNGFTR